MALGLSIFQKISEVILTMLYRYNIAPARRLVESHQMLESLNLRMEVLGWFESNKIFEISQIRAVVNLPLQPLQS